MSFDYSTKINNKALYSPSFGLNKDAILAAPIETVKKTIEDSFDKITKPSEDNKKKRANRAAIGAASAALVLSGIVLALNPKNPTKIIDKLKMLSNNIGLKLEKSKNDYLSSKFNKACLKSIEYSIKTINFLTNGNTGKDQAYVWLCSKKKSFNFIKNDKIRSFAKSIDDKFTSVMTKFNNTITKWFDNISKSTVRRKYSNAMYEIDSLDILINNLKSKLSVEEQVLLDNQIKALNIRKNFFKPVKVNERLNEQENLMSNLERDFKDKLKNYFKGLFDKTKTKDNKKEILSDNLGFWPEDIMKETKNIVGQEGKDAVRKLVGSGKGEKGIYDNIAEIFYNSENITDSDKKFVKKLVKSVRTKLKKANYCECSEYFDKKRDLVLGGATTDLVTAGLGLALSGALVAKADTKQEKISKLLTESFPIIAGVGASMVTTAMLFSGPVGLITGFAIGGIISKIGSILDNKFNPETISDKVEKEVKNG